ncbi:MAG: rhomboid family intramembrane serine protease [Verrucomicrobia bacterium]|nr:rhomboid family intramembrane serine protease [Verrucomicrobiota bacterium]MDA1086484.1 rhomboid family intramembrane serine protease [Verrucomicrobiota bacterium]
MFESIDRRAVGVGPITSIPPFTWFGLIGFLSAVGFSRGDRRSIFVTLMVLLFYGGAILSLGQRVPGVSWQMHLAGFISGVLCARWTRRLRR